MARRAGVSAYLAHALELELADCTSLIHPWAERPKTVASAGRHYDATVGALRRVAVGGRWGARRPRRPAPHGCLHYSPREA